MWEVEHAKEHIIRSQVVYAESKVIYWAGSNIKWVETIITVHLLSVFIEAKLTSFDDL